MPSKKKPPVLIQCKLCSYEGYSRQFASHLQMKHGIGAKEYTVKHILQQDKEPVCAYEGCNNEVRYVRLTYKKYCKEHSNLAMSEASANFTDRPPAWNKGKTKEDDPRLMKYSKLYAGEGNPFFGKRHPPELSERLRQQRFLSEDTYNARINNEIHKELTVLTEYKDYVSKNDPLTVLCGKCSNTFNKTLNELESGRRCPACYPPNCIVSRAEDEVVESLPIDPSLIIRNTRSVITPKELDIYIPSKQFAIEYNGLHWHTEEFCDSNSHLTKTKSCQELGIHLFHIFSDEWREKKDIVSSMLSHRLGMSARKLSARECTIKQVSTAEEARQFFDTTHISGYVPSRIVFGLYYGNELVSCLSLRKPIQKSRTSKYSNSIEIARFSTALNTHVRGAFGKLLKYAKQYAIGEGYENILTYADLRFGTGGVYEKSGFTPIGHTGIDYWYTDGSVRYNRFKFRAKPGVTEAQVALDNGVYKIYGCGSMKYLLSL
jgi:hypothetical protein